MTNADAAMLPFDALSALGVQISVDDFGASCSLLSRQQHFPAEHACDAVQGYLHGHPTPAQQVESLLRVVGDLA